MYAWTLHPGAIPGAMHSALSKLSIPCSVCRVYLDIDPVCHNNGCCLRRSTEYSVYGGVSHSRHCGTRYSVQETNFQLPTPTLQIQLIYVYSVLSQHYPIAY